jgi:hypothetical protein
MNNVGRGPAQAGHYVLAVAVLVAVVAIQATAAGQARRGQPAPARPATPATVTEPAKVQCPQVLGEGVQAKRTFCDVWIGRDPAAGIVIPLPPHTGPLTLTFDLHNRHTYSAELAKTNRGYRRYTATVGVLTMDNTPITMAVVHSEFRTAADLVDRVSGGTGAGGVKVVAPTGTETIVVTIPADEKTPSVSIVGLKLTEERIDGVDNFTATGRPVALISNVMLEYRPAPAPRAPARRK